MADVTRILALNCGSSSFKFGLYAADPNGTKLICEGEAEEIGRDSSRFSFRAPDGRKVNDEVSLPDHAAALSRVLEALKSSGAPEPNAAGHRFVHGGPRLREHQLVTPEVLKELRAAVAFAPLHVPPALSVLQAIMEEHSGMPQAICLDTAFHRNLPDVSKTFALPKEARVLGVERFGFHGLSLESILAQMHPVPGRLVVAHLGNGASVTAIRDGQSIDTTMGLTPTGGVMMGTRCGDLDPGAMVFLMRNGRLGADELERCFDHESGLVGISERTSDVRELMSLRKEDAKADLALRMFCYQARKAIGAMAAALGGLDVLVFTGGIGEHAGELRDEICGGLEFLGKAEVRVLAAEEDLEIAKITAHLAAGVERWHLGSRGSR